MTYTEDVRPGVWITVVRCLRLDGVVPGVAAKTLKEVLFYLAGYADYDHGYDVRPGTARIAVECEIDYRTAKRCLAAIRDLGLIRLVRSATRRGHADEYQLTVPADLHDRGILRTPAEVDAEIEHVRQRHRRDPTPASPAPTPTPATGPATTPVRVAPVPVPPAASPPVRDTQRPVQPPGDTDRTGRPVPANADRTVKSLRQYGSLYAPPPRHSTETTTTTEPTDTALRTAVTLVAHPPPEQDQILEVVDTAPSAAAESDGTDGPCATHPALAGGTRGDGLPRCAACRAVAVPRRSPDPRRCEHGFTKGDRRDPRAVGCLHCKPNATGSPPHLRLVRPA